VSSKEGSKKGKERKSMSAIKYECIVKGFTMLNKIHKYFSKFADFLGFFTISA
jgi:hypothetical protein